jgi:hypothetical protein
MFDRLRGRMFITRFYRYKHLTPKESEKPTIFLTLIKYYYVKPMPWLQWAKHTSYLKLTY